jgi:hypothetical protein
MYFNKFRAGADHALVGMVAFGSTQEAELVHPGV